MLRRSAWTLALIFWACAGDGESDGSGGAAGLGGTSGSGGGSGAGGSSEDSGADVSEDSDGAGEDVGSDASNDAADAGSSVTMSEIHQQHRFISGAMFGGWGPHLGHLVRAPASSGAIDALWFVDDVCAQTAADGPVCDVNHDHTLGYYERDGAGWHHRGDVTLPGMVQQNTATVMSKGELQTFGIDVGAHVIRECKYAAKTGPGGCATLPFTLGANANYIGAAVSPSGARLVWWTGVVDGGGGTFHYVVDYGGGWNGPRSGSAAGYNDASYANVAFGGDSATRVTFHGQLVSGLAPNWGFLGAVGYGDLATTDAVAWMDELVPVASDAVVSTNDVWTDPKTGDTHLVARTAGGSAAYFHRPKAGTWSAATFTWPATYRARFVPSGTRLGLVYGPNQGNLAYRIANEADRPAGSPIAWGDLLEQTVALPAGFGAVLAIYPETTAYQTSSVSNLNVALVGKGKEHVVLHVGLEL
ncbi:MAG: hypothetical protein U0263_11465 [Polyangiaceae bacterium]